MSLAELRILVVYERKAFPGVCGATIGADGSGVFAVGLTGDDADAKYERFLKACQTPGAGIKILHVITETFSCSTCLTIDPPCCLP